MMVYDTTKERHCTTLTQQEKGQKRVLKIVSVIVSVIVSIIPDNSIIIN